MEMCEEKIKQLTRIADALEGIYAFYKLDHTERTCRNCAFAGHVDENGWVRCGKHGETGRPQSVRIEKEGCNVHRFKEEL